MSLIPVDKWLSLVQKNADRVHKYTNAHDGSDGECDCIGLIIGAINMSGTYEYNGTHGSNYFTRCSTTGLKQITSANQLHVGQAIMKARKPGDEYYDLPDKYKSGGKYYNKDLNDYYHIGVVMSVNPLKIIHCTRMNSADNGGIYVDTKLGKWSYAAYINAVDYGAIDINDDVAPIPTPDIPDEDEGKKGQGMTAIVVGGRLNLRKNPTKNSQSLASIPNGSVLQVLNMDGTDWWQVMYNNIVGWVMQQYLELEDTDPDGQYADDGSDDTVPPDDGTSSDELVLKYINEIEKNLALLKSLLV